MSIINSFRYAIEGLISTMHVEKNLNIHFMVMILVIIFGFAVKLSTFEWIACIILFGLVISAEMFNTVIEMTLDYINEDYDGDIKLIKDASAAAVLVSAIAAAAIGLIIFIPKFV